MGDAVTLRRRAWCAAPVIAALAALAALGACSDQTKLREEEMTGLLALLPGRYDNTAQAELDARSGARPAHDAVTLVITRVYTPRLGHHVFYAQEMAADDARRVLSQRMYSFEVDEKRGIIQTVYQFLEPVRWRDGQQNKDLFTSVVTDDVQAEGCQLLWKKDGERFIAAYDPKVCPDRATQAELSVGALTLAGYKFRKGR